MDQLLAATGLAIYMRGGGGQGQKKRRRTNSVGFIETFENCVGSSSKDGGAGCQLYFLTFVSPSFRIPATWQSAAVAVFVDPSIPNESSECE